MQSTSWEMLNHKLESRLQGEVSITSNMKTTLMAEAKRKQRASDEVESGEWKAGLKLIIQKTKIMASGPITSWQIDREKMEIVAAFIFSGSKITADGDCSYETKRCLLFGRKAMTNLDSVLETKGITLPTEVHLVKAMTFPVVMYGCESWTIQKAEHWRIDAFELYCWRLLSVPWTERRSNQSILKEISPGCSLEGGMLKLKRQYFGHLMQEPTHWKRPWCWERLKAGGEGDDRGWDGWMTSLTQWTWVWTSLGCWRWVGWPGVLQYMGSQRVGHDWATDLTWTEVEKYLKFGLW